LSLRHTTANENQQSTDSYSLFSKDSDQIRKSKARVNHSTAKTSAAHFISPPNAAHGALRRVSILGEEIRAQSIGLSFTAENTA
jgi:hypothetical protein